MSSTHPHRQFMRVDYGRTMVRRTHAKGNRREGPPGSGGPPGTGRGLLGGGHGDKAGAGKGAWQLVRGTAGPALFLKNRKIRQRKEDMIK
jgi:hypothetical protein